MVYFVCECVCVLGCVFLFHSADAIGNVCGGCCLVDDALPAESSSETAHIPSPFAILFGTKVSPEGHVHRWRTCHKSDISICIAFQGVQSGNDRFVDRSMFIVFCETITIGL